MNQNLRDNNPDELSINDFRDLVNRFFYKVIYTIYRVINFYWRHKYVILILIITGLCAHFIRKHWLPQNYDTTAIVIQNFEAVDYLYNTVENIDDELSSQLNQPHLKQIFGSDYQRVKHITVEPIDNFYNFNDVDNQNKSDFDLFTRSKDVSVNIKEFKESIYFKYHKINFTITDTINTSNLIDNFFHYINNNSHFKQYAQAFKQNMKMKEKENLQSIASVDSLIASYIKQNEKSSQNISISNSSDIHFLYEQKEKLLNQNLNIQTKLVDYDQPIKPVTVLVKQPIKKLLPTNLLYPFLLVLIYSLIHLMRYLFRKSIQYQRD